MQKSKLKIRNDIILIAAVILLAAIGLIILVTASKEGSSVVVTIGGKHYASYPLDEDMRVVIVSEASSGTNVLVIENGEAYVEDASCPDLICANHSPISREWEAIMCRPNELVISIE